MQMEKKSLKQLIHWLTLQLCVYKSEAEAFQSNFSSTIVALNVFSGVSLEKEKE